MRVRIAKELQAHFTQVQKGKELERSVGKAEETKRGIAVGRYAEIFIIL